MSIMTAGGELKTLFSVRVYYALREAGIDTLEQLRSLSPAERKRLHNIGAKGQKEIERVLAAQAGKETPLKKDA